MTELHERSVFELSDGLARCEFSARELVQAYLDRINAHDRRFNSFVTVDAEAALQAAGEVDARRSRGEALGPLAGIPIGVKDSIPTAGIRTTSNSRLLEHWVPEADAAPIRRLRAAGAIVLGKTNLNEFGWALPNDGDLTPKPMNAWNPAYAAIGSSSGSGIAVAAGFVPAAVGTDGGGSARLPAGQHNLVGIKPTHGLLSRKGMDHSWIGEVSPLAQTVRDAALMLSIMAGREDRDWHTWPLSVPSYAEQHEESVAGWRVGVPRRLIEQAGMEAEVEASFSAALEVLRGLGAELVDVDLPGLSEARMANFVVLNAQQHAAHAPTLRKHPELYGRSARTYHWAGAFLSATDLLNALTIGARVRDLVQDAFTDIRAIVTPTSPVVTAEAARKPEQHRKGSNAVFTSPFNLTGHPAISLPAGFSASTGLPIGVQLVAPLFAEADLFTLGNAFERATDWRRPIRHRIVPRQTPRNPLK
ncbi:MAG TPA: amidase [Devosia sp.]|jgi:aspartyl-tRNA(Asn)/glutamyl-tRNA(Gln) amidotransferase subunit A|nr:amidase [Devosia sp.]